MENPNAIQRPQHPLTNYQFSADELRVLRECNSESFFQRSLPLGVGFGVAAFLGVKNGFMKPSIKYGAVPKIIVGVVIGYFAGKFSYQQKCAEKLMKLPNSKLAEVLRQRKQDGFMSRLAPDQSLGVGMALAPFTPSSLDVYSDEHLQDGSRSTALNLDTESRPTISGLDDIYRPSLDTSSSFYEPEIPIEPARPGMSYEELRKKNREEFSKLQQNALSRPLTSEAPPGTRVPPQTIFSEEDQQSAQHKAKRNKYGDTWTD